MFTMNPILPVGGQFAYLPDDINRLTLYIEFLSFRL